MSNEEFYHTLRPHPGSNREHSACEADAVTTIPWNYGTFKNQIRQILAFKISPQTNWCSSDNGFMAMHHNNVNYFGELCTTSVNYSHIVAV